MVAKSARFLLLGGLIAFLAVAASAVLAHRREGPPPRLGDAGDTATAAAPVSRGATAVAPTPPPNNAIGVVPYLRGVKAAPDQTGVSVYDPTAAHPGLNLVITTHAAEAMLTDMKGNVLHRWRRDFDSIWPGALVTAEDRLNGSYWRRVHLFRNGDLIAIFEGLGIVKLNAHSDVLWATRGTFHHDLDVADDGFVYALTRRNRWDSPAIWLQPPIVEDFITVLSPGGMPLRSWSILDAIAHSPFLPALARRPDGSDILHSNTIELIDGRHQAQRPMLQQGRVLISVRNLDLIGIVDLATGRLTWGLVAMTIRQHQPTVLPNGDLLVFDNRGNHDTARVFAFDPVTQVVTWSYAGTPDRPLQSQTLGSCQRLPNGNTLITESEAGRAIEVTPDHRVAWEYVTPLRAAEDDRLIASVFEVVRIELDYLEAGAIAGLAALRHDLDADAARQQLRALQR